MGRLILFLLGVPALVVFGGAFFICASMAFIDLTLEPFNPLNWGDEGRKMFAVIWLLLQFSVLFVWLNVLISN